MFLKIKKQRYQKNKRQTNFNKTILLNSIKQVPHATGEEDLEKRP